MAKASETYSLKGGGFDYWSMWRDGMKTVPVMEVQYTPVADPPAGSDLGNPQWTRSGGEAKLVETGAQTKEITKAGAVGAVGVGIEIGKGIGDAVGTYLLSKARAAQLNASAAISEDNARVAQFGVEQAFRAGEAQVAKVGYEQSMKKAQSRNAFAANGIAIGVGSTAEHLASIDIEAEVDKLTAKQNALAAAWGYRRQRIMGFAQAEGDRIMARATKSAGRVSMYSGLATTMMKAWAGYAGAS